MTRRFLMLAAAAGVLSACATTPPPILAPAASPLAELEPLYAVEAGRREVTIRVRSFGCTAKDDFAFFVERQGQAVTLAFGRRRLDVCRAAPRPVALTFTYAELGLSPREPVFLLNPILPVPGA